jgi:hypothetical protein
MTSFLTHADVEGVYETHVPLIFRAIMSLGNVAHVAHGKKIGSNETRVVLDTLSGKFGGQESSYLADGTFEHVYIYHSVRDSRHVFGIFLPNSKAHVFVVDKVINNQLGNIKYARTALNSSRPAIIFGVMSLLIRLYQQDDDLAASNTMRFSRTHKKDTMKTGPCQEGQSSPSST